VSSYGLTSYGVNIKRLDTILDEMHTDLTAAWGVNTRQNPNSLLNALLTNVADRIAELWELGQDVYNSQYPATAEGMYLDNVGQFAGVTRETDAPSYYHILCVGADGTLIPTETIISSTTNPVTNLMPVKQNTISRDTFNIATIRAVSINGNPLTVALNGKVYSVTPARGTDPSTALQALAEAITDDDFVATIGESDGLLHIAAIQETSINTLLLSDNLTTDSVGCVFTFKTEETGDIGLPAGSDCYLLQMLAHMSPAEIRRVTLITESPTWKKSFRIQSVWQIVFAARFSITVKALMRLPFMKTTRTKRMMPGAIRILLKLLLMVAMKLRSHSRF